MFNLAARSPWFVLIAVLIIVTGLVLALIPGGLQYGIDFKGGITVTLNTELGLDALRQELTALGQDQAVIQNLGGGDYFIRVRQMDDAEQQNFRSALDNLGSVQEFDSVSPVIATATTRNAGIAMGVAAVAMLLYITWAFRKMPNPFRYGAVAIVALIFNLLVVLAIFSIMGRLLDWQIDPMFITAILAIMGYSINDTIVVLDRVRENKARNLAQDFDITVNVSVMETLARSLNTVITTVFAVLAVYLWVGGPIRSFLLALFVGFVAGAYSSIFVAGPLLVWWEHRGWRRLIPRLPFSRATASP